MSIYASYFFKSHETGTVNWLEQTSFSEAFEYVEKCYGKAWRDLGTIYCYQAIAA